MTGPRRTETIDDVLAVLRQIVGESSVAADRTGARDPSPVVTDR